jgi:hypothetical protein
MFERFSWRATLSMAVGVVCGCALIAYTPDAAGEPPGSCGNTAAGANGWGAPTREENFDSPSLPGWDVYDGPGHAGNGRRTSAAVNVSDGRLTITGDSSGNSGGMALFPGQKYGRWEACVRSTVAADGYHSVLLLWPDAENWPRGGEVDFMEIKTGSRQLVEGNLLSGHNKRWQGSTVAVDATQWHSWAVEWTSEKLAFYLDGRPWWTTTNTADLPPGSMHFCIQLDNFGGDLSEGGQLIADWVRQYRA